MSEAASRQLDGCRDLLERTRKRLGLVHPRRRFNDWSQRLDEARAGLIRSARRSARQHRIRWQELAGRLGRLRPRLLLRRRCEGLTQVFQRLTAHAQKQLGDKQSRFVTLNERLRLLGPEQVLGRGYSITMDEATGKVIRAAQGLKQGQRLRTRVKAGEIISRVER